MWKFSACAIGIAGLAACASNQTPAVSASAQHPDQPPALRPGIDLQYVDSSVRPQDDTYQYLNGKWLRTFQLPRDKGAVGSFSAVEDATEEQLRSIVESLDQAEVPNEFVHGTDATNRDATAAFGNFIMNVAGRQNRLGTAA